jgi:hypothetical protein
MLSALLSPPPPGNKIQIGRNSGRFGFEIIAEIVIFVTIPRDETGSVFKINTRTSNRTDLITLPAHYES